MEATLQKERLVLMVLPSFKIASKPTAILCSWANLGKYEILAIRGTIDLIYSPYS